MSEAKESLHSWCETGNLVKVREYLNGEDEGSLSEQLSTVSLSSGLTPLQEATASGNPHIVSLILERAKELGKYIVNTKSRNGQTALHLAAGLDSGDCAEILLRNGADDSITDLDGKMPLQYVSAGKESVLRAFWNNELFLAVQNDSSTVVEMLKEVPLGERGKEILNKCLMAATENDNSVNIGVLVLKGADNLQACLKVAVQQGKNKARAMLMMVLAVALNDVKFVHKLYGEQVEVEKFYKPYFTDSNFSQVQQIIKCGMMSTVIPLALTLKLEDRSEVRDAFLMRTDVNKADGSVGWSWLRLQQIEESRLKQISWVKTLNLAGNELEVLPSAFGACVPNVAFLNLEHNELVAIPVSIFQLPFLKDLRMCHNKLTFLPTVSEWPMLTHLDISYNQLGSLPSNIYAPQLLAFNLAHNNLSAVPPCVLSFGALTSLDLSSNYEISSIPEDINHLKNLTDLKLEDLDNLQLSSPTNLKEFYTMKIVVVGEEQAGKSALVSTLKGEKIRSRSASVDVSDWHYDGESKREIFHFNIWNFKGHRAKYTHHQCLFSDNTLYIVVFDICKGEKAIERAKEWVNVIIGCSNSHPASIILAGTHFDEIPFRKKSSVHELLKKVSTSLPKSGDRNCLISVVIVGLKNDVENVAYLRKEVYRLADLCKNKDGKNVMGQKIPVSYHKLAEKIKFLQQEAIRENISPVMTEKKLQSILENESLDHLFNYEKDVNDMSAFLNSTGLLTHYNDRRHNLNTLYFLDPQWLDNCLSTLLSNCFPINKFGIVLFSKFSKACENQDQQKYFAQCLVILSRYHLVMAINTERILLPSKLSSKRPACLEKQFTEGPSFQSRTIPFAMNTVIPEGFWSQLLRWIIKSFDKLAEIVLESNSLQDIGSEFSLFGSRQDQEFAIWQHGIYYIDHEVTFRIEALDFSRPHRLEQGPGVFILVSCNQLGSQYAESLAYIVVYSIKAWFPTLDGDQLITARHEVPCYECVKQNRRSPFKFTVENIIKELNKSNVYIVCGYYPQPDDNHSVKVSDVFVQILKSNL